MRRAEIRAQLDALQSLDLPVHQGRTLAYVYDSGRPDAEAVGREALGMFADTNGLDPTSFPSLLVMENDLVAQAGALLNAPPGFAGTATSGGTESILMAVLAARDARPDITAPSMVLPSTAHAAFYKAAHYFGVRAVAVDVDPVTKRAVPAAMASACDDSTVLIIASAPSFSFGVLDPIEEIAAIGEAHGIRCHVDACIGGWVLPHLDNVPPWDFRVPGVTSVSVDLHKYGYTPKGISLLLHRSAELRRSHYFAWSAWPGYSVVNPAMQSTRSGGPIAAAWAITHAVGREGYAELARTTRSAVQEVCRRVESEIAGLRVVGSPDVTLAALETDGTCDVFTIADEMLERGWFVQPQMSFGGQAPTVHLTLSAAIAPELDGFMEALASSVAAARRAGPLELPAGVVALASSLTPEMMTPETLAALIEQAGVGDGERLALPDRMAPINLLLDTLSPPVRDIVLIDFLGRLATPGLARPPQVASLSGER